jgi:hypothetical protein
MATPTWAKKLSDRTNAREILNKQSRQLNREELINALVTQTKMSRKDAAEQVDIWMGEK